MIFIQNPNSNPLRFIELDIPILMIPSDLAQFKQINAIIERDSKDATYKFALLRGAIEISQEYDHLKRDAGDRVEFPLGLLAIVESHGKHRASKRHSADQINSIQDLIDRIICLFIPHKNYKNI